MAGRRPTLRIDEKYDHPLMIHTKSTKPPKYPASHLATGRTLVLSLACWILAGCAPVWHYEFEVAENITRAQEKEMLVFFKDSLDIHSSKMEKVLENPLVKAQFANRVLCKLVSDFPPHRRYVAQYEVLQPPALILIHVDGTFHRYSGLPDPEQVQQFLASSKAPGIAPTANPQIARNIDYRWEGVYKNAVAKAERMNRKLFVVYKWWLSPESTELLSVLLNRPEVARHFAETVNCLLDMDYLPNRSHVRRYGITDVPAVILIDRDGTYHAHSGPMTADQLIRFAVRSANTPGKKPSSAFTDRMETRASYHWYSEFTRAIAHARNRGVNLFVFYHSLYSDQSSKMARLLDQSRVADMFQGTINCRLDFSDASNRQLMSRYRIDRGPAFLVVRPDGSYHKRSGLVTADDLADLLRAAEKPGSVPRRAGVAP